MVLKTAAHKFHDAKFIPILTNFFEVERTQSHNYHKALMGSRTYCTFVQNTSNFFV